MRFPEKFYGRLYVLKEEDIQIVKDTIKEMDEFEFDYLPDDLITCYTGETKYSYVHKFYSIDLDNLIDNCWKKGVVVFYVVKQQESNYIRALVEAIEEQADKIHELELTIKDYEHMLDKNGWTENN